MTVEIREAAVDDIPTVRVLFLEYAVSLGIDLCFQKFDEELASLPGAYAPPTGKLLVAWDEQTPAGCIAFRQLGEGRCELKRLYVRPAFRGRGLGRLLATRALEEARNAGYESASLDTLPSMTEAIALYRALGFTPTDPYCHNPVPGALFFAKSLGPRRSGMRIIEQKVSGGGAIFDLDEFLSRPLFAHLAHDSGHGPRESPVWFHWDGTAIWILGGESFPANLKRDPRCAIGIVDWNPATGRCHHAGMRGRAEVLPFDVTIARTIFRRYFGPDESDWDTRFADLFADSAKVEMVRFTPDTVVVRDQSYRPTRWAQERL